MPKGALMPKEAKGVEKEGKWEGRGERGEQAGEGLWLV